MHPGLTIVFVSLYCAHNDTYIHSLLVGWLHGVAFPAPSRHSYSLTDPSLEFMILFWNMKNKTATGTVITTAAANLTGYWLPALS
jgi:hypothetical protein